MTINFAAMPITLTGTTTSRTIGARFADILNVKDYGAMGDGATDDSAAIQATLNAAFGTVASPHGNNRDLNKPVFFPAGNYLVGQPLNIASVSGAWIFGAGSRCTRLTYNGNVPPTPTFTVTINSPAVFTCTNHGYAVNDQVFFITTGALPTGLSVYTTYYVIAAGLGADTFEVSATLGGPAINTSGSQSGTHSLLVSVMTANGMTYSNIEGLSFDISDNTNTYGFNLAHPVGTTFGMTNVLFTDIATFNATIGIEIGAGGSDGGDGLCFINCEFNDHSFAGACSTNFNAIANGMINCKFTNCGAAPPAANAVPPAYSAALSGQAGTFETILGCWFEESNSYDIAFAPGQGLWVAGCRSVNTSTGLNDCPAFMFSNGPTKIDGLVFSTPNSSSNRVGIINAGWIMDGCDLSDSRATFRLQGAPSRLYVRGSTFATSSAVTNFTGNIAQNI